MANQLLIGIAAYWKMDEEGGATQYHDSTFNENHLDVFEDATVITGKLHNAFHKNQNGIHDYLTIGDDDQTNLDLIGDFSISFWVNVPSSFSNYHGVFYKAANSSNRTAWSGFNSNGNFTFGTEGETGGGHALTSDTTFNADTWYHIVVTYDSSTKEKIMYVNGEEDVSATAGHSGALNTSTAAFRIGLVEQLSGGTLSKEIKVDEMGVWKRALSSNDVDILYNNGEPFPLGCFDSKGDQGATGIQGASGLQGSQGQTGLQGPQGDQGDQGITGLQGIQGSQGITGLQGDNGLEGSQGQTGIQGLTGTQGIQGIQGDQGNTGIQGETGPQGVTGDNPITFFANYHMEFLGHSQSQEPLILFTGINAIELSTPYSGSIVAIAVTYEDVRDDGTATFRPTINGAGQTDLNCALDGDNIQHNTATVADNTVAFSAGDLIGVEVDTTSDFTFFDKCAQVALWVIFD